MCIRDSGKRVIGTPAHYAYLKIAEGCNNRCHYCAIPGLRGPLHSRDMADCVAEARWLAGEGVKELIVVCLLYTSTWWKSCWISAVCRTAASVWTAARWTLWQS